MLPHQLCRALGALLASVDSWFVADMPTATRFGYYVSRSKQRRQVILSQACCSNVQNYHLATAFAASTAQRQSEVYKEHRELGSLHAIVMHQRRSLPAVWV